MELTGSHWSWNSKLLRLAFMLKREAIQACIYIENVKLHMLAFMLKRDPEICISKNSTTIAFGRECEVRVWGWNATSAFDEGREVCVWIEMRPSRLAWDLCLRLEHDLRVCEVHAEALSSVIFRQPTGGRSWDNLYELSQLFCMNRHNCSVNHSHSRT